MYRNVATEMARPKSRVPVFINWVLCNAFLWKLSVHSHIAFNRQLQDSPPVTAKAAARATAQVKSAAYHSWHSERSGTSRINKTELLLSVYMYFEGLLLHIHLRAASNSLSFNQPFA